MYVCLCVCVCVKKKKSYHVFQLTRHTYVTLGYSNTHLPQNRKLLNRKRRTTNRKWSLAQNNTELPQFIRSHKHTDKHTHLYSTYPFTSNLTNTVYPLSCSTILALSPPFPIASLYASCIYTILCLYVLCTFFICIVACSSWYMYDFFCYVPECFPSPSFFHKNIVLFWHYINKIKGVKFSFLKCWPMWEWQNPISSPFSSLLPSKHPHSLLLLSLKVSSSSGQSLPLTGACGLLREIQVFLSVKHISTIPMVSNSTFVKHLLKTTPKTRLSCSKTLRRVWQQW